MDKHKTNLLIKMLLLLASYSLILCAQACADNKTLSKSMVPPNLDRVDEFASIVIDRRLSTGIRDLWRVKLSFLKKNIDLKKVTFPNTALGFISASNGLLFKISDDGESWNRIADMGSLSIQDLFFSSANDGYAIGVRSAHEGKNHISMIMKTTDAGKHWVSVYSTTTHRLERISFTTNGIGIAVGRTTEFSPIADTKYFVALSRDAGLSWIDVSETLNHFARDAKGRIGDYLTDIKIYDDDVVYLGSQRGSVFRSSDFAESWMLVSRVPDERDQTRFGRIGILDSGETWVGGGAISIEGNWGLLAINDVQGWKVFRLEGYYFTDFFFLSHNEVIATGSIVAPYNIGGSNERNRAVILFSQDQGKTWSVLHESTTSSEFTAIAEQSESTFIISGKNGEIVTLQRSQ